MARPALARLIALNGPTEQTERQITLDSPLIVDLKMRLKMLNQLVGVGLHLIDHGMLYVYVSVRCTELL